MRNDHSEYRWFLRPVITEMKLWYGGHNAGAIFDQMSVVPGVSVDVAHDGPVTATCECAMRTVTQSCTNCSTCTDPCCALCSVEQAEITNLLMKRFLSQCQSLTDRSVSPLTPLTLRQSCTLRFSSALPEGRSFQSPAHPDRLRARREPAERVF